MINLITIFCLSYIIATTDFPLVVWIKDKLGLGDNRTLLSKNKYIDYFYKFIHKIINCSICLSFWGILLFTFNIKYAIIAYVLMTLLSNIIEFFKSNIKY